MKTIRIRFKQHGMHTHMRVFVGEPGKTFGKAGDLVMRPDEANAFFTALQVGPNGPIGSDMPVEIGLDDDAVSDVPVFEVKERNPFIEGPAPEWCCASAKISNGWQHDTGCPRKVGP